MAKTKISITVSQDDDGTGFKGSKKKVIESEKELGEILAEVSKLDQTLTGRVPLPGTEE